MILGFALLLAVPAVLAVPAAPAAAGPPDRVPDQEGRINPRLAVVDIVSSRGGTVDSTRVDCYYRLSNELFNFVKSGDRYVARFELSLIVIDDDDYQVSAETIRDSIAVETDAQTRVMDHSRAKLYTTYLPPGKYDLEIKLYDQDTGNQHDMSPALRGAGLLQGPAQHKRHTVRRTGPGRIFPDRPGTERHPDRSQPVPRLR